MEGIAELLEILMPFLEELARTIEGAAPVVWNIMLRKVIAEGVQYLIWAALSVAVFVGVNREIKKDTVKKNWYAEAFCVKWAAAIATTIFCTLAVSQFIASDYYVLLRFMELIQGTGQ